MKIRALNFLAAFCLAITANLAHATVLVWTNTAGGSWNAMNNWSPNQVPIAGDDVVITNAGTYTVSGVAGQTLHSLVMGGSSSGIQTLFGGALILTNASMIGPNAVFNWAGGDLESSLTIAVGATLTISNNCYFSEQNDPKSNTAYLTNFGTVICAGTIYGNGNNAGVGGGLIMNAGLWQAVAPVSLINQLSPSNTFINSGTLEQIGTAGTVNINWNFTSTGTINSTNGSFSLNWFGPSTLYGSITESSSTISAQLTVASNSVLNLFGGDLEGSITVLQGGFLTISNTFYFSQNNSSSRSNLATLTNFGTVTCQASIYGYGNSSGAGGGTIINSGLWQSVAAIGIFNQSSPSNTFINTGTLEQSASGAATINWTFNNNGGTINNMLNGSFSMGNWLGTGLVYGSPSLSGGTISGTLAAGDLITFSAGVNGALIVSSNAQANWIGGDLEGSINVLQGGILTISNSVYASQNNSSTRSNIATLTNFGTVTWAGNIYSYGNGSGAGGAVFENDGIWNAVAAISLISQSSPSNTFINDGTFAQTVGSGGVNVAWTFYNNSGTVNTAAGTFAMANWVGNGTVYGTALFSSGTISGTLAPGALMTFSSVNISGAFTISSNAQANWNGGDLEGSVTVLQGGTFAISNTVYFSQNNSSTRSNTATMTNYGTVIWQGNIYGDGNSSGAGGGFILNAGLWNAVADNSMNNQSSPSNTFLNVGTLEKTGGTSTSTINWNFISTGTISNSTGTFSFNWAGPSTLNGYLTLSSATILTPLSIASNAVLNLSGGDLESSLTVLQGGTLTISNTFFFAQNNSTTKSNLATLTNFGTVIWSGTIYGYGNSSGAGGGLIDNAGVWDAVSASSLINQSSPSNTFINSGTLEQTAGVSGSTINWFFINSGIIETPTGSFALDWFAPSTIQGNFTLAAGTMSYPLTLASNSVMNLAGGDLESSLTVLQGATLTISNTLYFAQNNYSPGGTNTATLTNFGTVFWGGTAINGSGNSTNHSIGGVIYNAGLWQMSAGGQMGNYGYAGTNTVFNTGIFQQTVGSGTTSINWNFLNTGGVLGCQTNTLSLAGNYNLTNGTLNFGINSFAHYGIITLSGAPAAITGSLTVNFNNGYVASTGSAFPVLTYGTATGTFTNANLPFSVAWQTNYGNSAFALTVLNVRPTLAPLNDQTLDELTSLSVYPNATDPDAGQSLTFALPAAPAGMTIAPNTGIISWTPSQMESPSTNTVLVSVTDNGNPVLSATNSFQVVVVEVNTAPVLPSISHVSVNEQAPLSVTNTASESNIHAAITGYGLVNAPTGMNISASGVITWTPTQAQSPGAYFITTIATNLDAFDLVNPILMATNTIAVVVNEVNAVPVFSTAPAQQTVNETALLSVTNAATDANIHAALSYSLLDAPTNMNISSSGIITWTPAQIQSPGTNVITTVATAADPFDMVNPQLTVTNQFTVVVKEVNIAPALPAIPTQTIGELTLLTVTNTASESNIHATNVAYGLVTAPTNMSINPTNGVITWIPTQSQSPGTNLITTVVTNTDTFDTVNPHLTATNTFTVIVREINEAPVLPVIPPQAVNPLTLLTVTNSATENDIHAAVSYALISPPAGAAINTNGIFTWTPAQNQGPSTNTIMVVAISTDSADGQNPVVASISSFSVTVSAPIVPPVNLGPLIFSGGHAQITVNGPVGSNYVLQASTLLNPGTWIPLLTNIPPSSPFTLTDSNAGAFSKRFYRIQFGP